VVLTAAGILLAFASIAIDRARGTVDAPRDPARPATGSVPVNAL
jgi:DHA1 family inner membrane transport protein